MSLEINPTGSTTGSSSSLTRPLPRVSRQSESKLSVTQDLSTLHVENLEIETKPVGKASDPVALIDASDSDSLRQQLNDLISERLSSPNPTWYSEEGACMDFAALWYQDLKAKGLPVSLAITDTKGPQGKTLLDSQQEISVDKVHAFIVVQTQDGELIVDPTWKQFAADKKTVSHLPSIAFGTIAEIKNMYANAKHQLQLETHGHDPLQGRYQIETAVDLLYSTGTHHAYRQLLNE